MSDAILDAEVPGDLGLTAAEFAAARDEREGAAWFRDNAPVLASIIEGTPIHHPPSATPISDRAFDLIVEFEVSSPAVYEQKYRGAVWPGGASGVTVGIGYDVGYVSAAQLRADWGDMVPLTTLNALLGAVGITGAAAKDTAAALVKRIDISFAVAIDVHRRRVVPRWTGLTEDALANTGLLSPESLGALVSLTYNRGAQYSTAGDRAMEMRNIRDHMGTKRFDLVPGEIRAMKRLWPDVSGLRRRRDLEAALFEHGLTA